MASPIGYMIAVMEGFRDGGIVQKRMRAQPASPASGWVEDPNPRWDWNNFEYRAKPKPREFWMNVYNTAVYCYPTKEEADAKRCQNSNECIRVREVLDEATE